MIIFEVIGIWRVIILFSLLSCMFGIFHSKKIKNKNDPHRLNIGIREIHSRDFPGSPLGKTLRALVLQPRPGVAKNKQTNK